MFLEFDISISHSVRDTFLSTGNEAAYRVRTPLEHLQLFRQKLSHKSAKAYVTMPIDIMGRKSLALID